MNVEIGAEAALFPEKEYINGIFLAACPGKQFLPISPKFSCWNISPKNRRNKDISSQGILISWLPQKFRR
jgi:hypothetical protein